MKDDLNNASALVRQEIKNLADTIAGISIKPRFIDAESFAQAQQLFVQISKNIQTVGDTSRDAAKKVSNLFGALDSAAKTTIVNTKLIRNSQEAVERAQLLAIQKDVEKTEAANAQKLADTLRTLKAEESARAALDKQRQDALRAAAADERLRSKELADQNLAGLREAQRVEGAKTVQRTGIETGAKSRAQDIFQADLRAAESEYQRQAATGADAAKGRLKDLAEAQTVARDRFIQINQALTGLRTAGLTLTAFVTAPLVAGAEAALKYAGNMERVTVSLQNTAGGTQPALKLLQQVKELALQSPFDFQVLLQGTKRLNAFGFETKDVVRILKTLGDATAAVGGDSGTLNRLIKAFGDIKQKGFLTGEEIRQLGNAPLGAVKIIAEELGITTDKVLDGTKKKAVDANTAIALILDGINKKFGGEQQRQSETLLGNLQVLTTKYQFFAADVGKILAPAAKDLLKTAEGFLETGKSLATTFAGLPEPIRNTGLAIAGLATVTGPVLASIGQLGLGIQGLSKVYTALAGISSLSGFVGTLVELAPWVALAGAIFYAGLKLEEFGRKGKTALNPVGSNVVGKGFTGNLSSHASNSELPGSGGEFSSPLTQFLDFDPDGAAAKAKADLLKKLSGDTADEAVRAREKLFSTVGLQDIKTEYKRIADAVDQLWGALNRTQKTQATTLLEDRLRQLGKQGELTAAQVDAAITKIDDRLDKAGGPVSFSAPKIFEVPKGFDASTELARLKQADLRKEFDAGIAVIKEYQLNLQAYRNVQDGSTNATDIFRASLLDQSTIFEEFRPKIDAITEAHARSSSTIDGVIKKYNDLKTILGELSDENIVKIGRATATLKEFGINPDKGISNLTASYAALLKERQDNVTFADGTEVISLANVERAWYKLAQAHLAAGERLSAADEATYQRIKKQESGVKLLQQSYREFGSQVSTIFNDLAKGIADLIAPKTGAATPLLPANITSAFKTAFETLSGQGYANADQRLKDVTQSIIHAGTAAQANAIAIRTFGAQGPVIANLLRSGQLSVEQINFALKQGSDILGKYSAEATTKLSKVAQLWKEVENALVRALLETGAKAIARSISESLTPYIHKLEELLAKLPLVGTALAKVFGIGKTANLPSLGGITIPGGGPSPIPIPGVPGGLPTVTGPGGGQVSLPSGGGGVAGKASSLSSTLQTVSQIANVVTAVSTALAGIVAGVQAAHANALLDKIEKSTRGTLNVLVGETDHDESIFGFTKKTSQYAVFMHDRLVEIGNKLIDPVTTTLESIANHGAKVQAAGAVSGGGGDTYYISISGGAYAAAGDAGIIQSAQALTKLLKARGIGK